MIKKSKANKAATQLVNYIKGINEEFVGLTSDIEGTDFTPNYDKLHSELVSAFLNI